jgi:hypothetical protein
MHILIYDMKLSTRPLFYGIWLLRYTNDLTIDRASTNYLVVDDPETVKFKSLAYDKNHLVGLGIKKSRTASVKPIEERNDDTLLVSFQYIKKNIYTYSFLGIEIPEIQTDSLEYYKERNLTIQLDNNRVLLIHDNEKSLFYVFDLYLGKIRYPNIETSLNTFLFTQLFGILIGILINKLFTSS